MTYYLDIEKHLSRKADINKHHKEEGDKMIKILLYNITPFFNYCIYWLFMYDNIFIADHDLSIERPKADCSDWNIKKRDLLIIETAALFSL